MTIHTRPLAALLFLMTPWLASAQGTSGPVVSDSSIGYIDSAIPGNQFRLRFDDANNIQRANRAEFIYARGAPFGPGLPVPERSIDYDDMSAYAELLIGSNVSVFGEVPMRWLNPDINNNTAGLADVNVGCKWAFLQSCSSLTTFQLRSYLPAGDSHRGLGTHHVSLEPALLFYQRCSERFRVEGELRWWTAIGGTDFAGDVVRYGIGAHYDLYRDCCARVTPVLELVGWEVVDGKQGVFVSPGNALVEDAAGDSIINIKFGVRAGWNRFDVYGGYGRALTGDTWYEDTFRLECRYQF